ncbi:hypothetical protein, partial [Ensifer aridi]|uniref:hypothetical protein n=1 Tax=Ensifer aridi TaxID=1708715 RepID=UPI001AECD5BD
RHIVDSANGPFMGTDAKIGEPPARSRCNPSSEHSAVAGHSSSAQGKIRKVIEDALRLTGLMLK